MKTPLQEFTDFLENDIKITLSEDKWAKYHTKVAELLEAESKYESTLRRKIALELETITDSDEPYFGWCDVDGCENEACCGGTVWRDTGYWRACYKHSDEYRQGKPQPKMKEESIKREKSRLPDGTLPVS